MTSQEFTIAFFHRIKKNKYLIVCVALICSAVFIIYALKTPMTYTSTATIFPLTASGDNGSATSALSALFSGVDNNQSFTNDASVNIVELALSRTTREAVAAIRDSSHGNKTIAELLITNINDHRSFLESKIPVPPSEEAMITKAVQILKDGLSASINKNNSFVLTYTGRSPELVKMISYGFINKISVFYIDLKREKSKRDFEFATSKVDSLKHIMNAKDNQLIAIDKRTLFTNTSKMEFRVPTENLITDKQMLRQLYAVAVANQQNAAYKLQKATPVIKVLDYPEPPYDVQNKSPLIYGIIGLFIGFILSTGYSSIRLLVRYAKEETSKAIYGEKNENTSSTVAAS